MTLVMRCEEKDRLVGYLYDEGTPAERTAVRAHLLRCAACAAELDELKAVRVHLAGWNAPDTDLGFRVTREPLVDKAPPRARALPLWAQAAAAVLVLAAGAGLANLQIQYGSQGLTVRTGWGSTPAPPAAVTPDTQAVQANAVTTAQLRALEDRVARAERAARAGSPAPAPATPAAGASTRDVVQEMRTLLADSEERQRQEFAFRLAQVLRDVEAQRSTDLVRIDQNLRQLEGVTGEQMRGQHEMINYLRRVSSPRP